MSFGRKQVVMTMEMKLCAAVLGNSVQCCGAIHASCRAVEPLMQQSALWCRSGNVTAPRGIAVSPPSAHNMGA